MVFIIPLLPPRPAIEATLMMRPDLRGIMLRRATSWLITNRLRMFRSITLSQASTGWSSAGAPQVAPALFTRMSILPSLAIVCSTMPRACASSDASAAIHCASMPRAFRCATASSRSAALRELSMSVAPASPSASAICKPSPRDPPVTSATWPLRSKRSCTLLLIVVSLMS